MINKIIKIYEEDLKQKDEIIKKLLEEIKFLQMENEKYKNCLQNKNL